MNKVYAKENIRYSHLSKPLLSIRLRHRSKNDCFHSQRTGKYLHSWTKLPGWVRCWYFIKKVFIAHVMISAAFHIAVNVS